MATLTNTKIKDTYVGLLKTTDNQAIDASGVTLVEDGAGNASALSVGRSGNGVSVSGNLAVDTDTLYVDATNNRVGIGTSNPDTIFHIQDANPTAKIFSNNSSGNSSILSLGKAYNGSSTIEFHNASSGEPLVAQIQCDSDENMVFETNPDGSLGSNNNFIFQQNGSEVMRIDSSGNVGIGTSNPSRRFHVNAGTDNTVALFESTDSNAQIEIKDDTASSELSHNGSSFSIKVDPDNVGVGSNFLVTIDNDEKMRIDSNGYFRLAGAGIQFNGDTADDNSLDDYEEGTWTPTYTTVDGDFDTIDYGNQTGRYTKIGRVVYCDLFLRAGNITYSGSVTAGSDIRINGLPFASIGGFAQAGGSIAFINNWGNINNPNGITVQTGTGGIALTFLSQTDSRYAVSVSDLDTGAANSRNDIRMSFFYFV